MGDTTMREITLKKYFPATVVPLVTEKDDPAGLSFLCLLSACERRDRSRC